MRNVNDDLKDPCHIYNEAKVCVLPCPLFLILGKDSLPVWAVSRVKG